MVMKKDVTKRIYFLLVKSKTANIKKKYVAVFHEFRDIIYI